MDTCAWKVPQRRITVLVDVDAMGLQVRSLRESLSANVADDWITFQWLKNTVKYQYPVHFTLYTTYTLSGANSTMFN